MLKKSFFSLAVLLLGFGGMMMPQELSATSFHHSPDKEVPPNVKEAVCCKMADLEECLNFDTAVQLLGTGRITVTKKGEGVYVVEYGGNALILVLEDNNI